jgi:hypothetical protein
VVQLENCTAVIVHKTSTVHHSLQKKVAKPLKSTLSQQMLFRQLCSIHRVTLLRLQRGVSSRSVNLFDTLSKTKLAIAPERDISWYCCGPTVYDSAHLGHARTYVCFDICRRICERLLQRPVVYVMGVTDVDDKILARAAESGVFGAHQVMRCSRVCEMFFTRFRPDLFSGVTPAAIAKRFEVEFSADMASLGVRPPTAVVRVTEHIDCIIDHIAVSAVPLCFFYERASSRRRPSCARRPFAPKGLHTMLLTAAECILILKQWVRRTASCALFPPTVFRSRACTRGKCLTSDTRVISPCGRPSRVGTLL